MASKATSQNLSKDQESEIKREKYFEQITVLLEENELVFKRLPPGPNSLMRAVSDAFYLTSQYHDQIQQGLRLHLKNLISANKLPQRLNMFQGNNMLWKDYSSNPNLPGFEKINLELVSSFYKVKVLLYNMQEDGQFTATIINNKYRDSLQLIRSPGNLYHPVYSIEQYSKFGFCQNIVLNLINLAVHGTAKFQNLNQEKYINYEYDNFISSKAKSKDQEAPIKPRHKKSLSDGFDKAFLDSGDQDMKFYNMFMNLKPPEDFIKLLKSERKDTADSNLARNANLDFIDDAWISPRKMEFGVKNYPVPMSGLSSTNGSLKEIPETRTREQLGPKSANNIFFSENMSISEIEKLEKAPQKEVNTISPIHFLHSPPPGLTPSRYPQKSTPITDVNVHQSTEYISPSTFQKPDMMVNNQVSYSYSSPEKGANFPGFANPQFGQNNLYSKRTGNKNLLLPTQSEEMSPEQLQAFRQSNPNTVEKKKPIILEESKQRFTGRLKFFDEGKNYGFIVMDEDNSDIFVHYDDLSKANISKDLLKTARLGNIIKLSFSCMKYVGKYDKSRKATEIILLEQEHDEADYEEQL